MVAMLKASLEHNWRVAIVETDHIGCSAIYLIQFFKYPRSTVYDVVEKYKNQRNPMKVGFQNW